MADENLKIREDAIKIQVRDIEDVTRGLELENTKVSVVLAFESLLLVESLGQIKYTTPLIKTVFIFPLLVSMSISFYNLFAKKIKSHTDVGGVFVRKDSYKNWSDYIDVKHIRLDGVYEETQRLLRQKSHLTNWAFIFLFLSVIALATSIGGDFGMTEQKIDKHIGETVPITSQNGSSHPKEETKESGDRDAGGKTPLLVPLETLKGKEPAGNVEDRKELRK